MNRPLFKISTSFPKDKILQKIFTKNGGLYSYTKAELEIPSSSQQGFLQILSPKNALELCSNFFFVLQQEKCLVILPPHTDTEKKNYLQHLPSSIEIPKEIRLITFTSGNEGNPKAVLHSEKNLLTAALQTQKALNKNANLFCALPPWGMAGIHFLFLLPLLNHSFAATSEESFLFFCPFLQQNLKNAEIAYLILNPWLVQTMYERTPAYELEQKVISLTAPLHKKLRSTFQEKFSATLDEIYGMSEAAGPIAYNGKSMGVKTKLSKDGELLIQGEQLAFAYACDEKIEKIPEWFSTGDIVKSSEDLLILSRKKELINHGGRKFPPRFIEEILLNYHGINQCMAYAINDIKYGESVAVQLVVNSSFSSENFGKFLDRNLSPGLRPRKWEIVTSLTRSVSGKIVRRRVWKVQRE